MILCTKSNHYIVRFILILKHLLGLPTLNLTSHKFLPNTTLIPLYICPYNQIHYLILFHIASQSALLKSTTNLLVNTCRLATNCLPPRSASVSGKIPDFVTPTTLPKISITRSYNGLHNSASNQYTQH